MILARLARLRAEFQKKSEIAFPAELVGIGATESARRIVEQERLVFESRSNSRATQMAALRQLKDHLGQEVVSLTGQIKTHKRQRELMAVELEQDSGLSKKGLAPEPRKLALERNSAQLEGDGLRLETSLQRAHQELSKTDIAMIELENKRSDELTDALLQSEIRLDLVEDKLATTGALLHEAQVLAPMQQAAASRRALPVVRYAIVRARREGSVEIEASELTQVLPGDTVKVSVGDGSEPSPAVLENSGKPPRPADPRNGAARTLARASRRVDEAVGHKDHREYCGGTQACAAYCDRRALRISRRASRVRSRVPRAHAAASGSIPSTSGGRVRRGT